MVNGRIDKYQFEEGYCQAEKSSSDKNKDIFTFYYYDQDHLGNIRQVREADGSKKGEVIQTMNYYPFGAEFCDNGAKNYTQKHKYNGKEFDNMHGLNSYDYGARQYNPVTARWDRIDPLCEKYYSVSPYNYCHNNPVMLTDPDGMDDYYTRYGDFLGTVDTETDIIYIANDYIPLGDGSYGINPETRQKWTDSSLELSADACSKILTNSLALGGYNTNELVDGRIQVNVIGRVGDNNLPIGDRCTPNSGNLVVSENDPSHVTSLAFADFKIGPRITVNFEPGTTEGDMFSTRSNIISLVGDHEFKGHIKYGYHHEKDGFIDTVNFMQESSPTWENTTQEFKDYINKTHH